MRACVRIDVCTKMNRTMYLLFLLFLERIGYLETVASVSTSKQNVTQIAPFPPTNTYIHTQATHTLTLTHIHTDIQTR